METTPTIPKDLSFEKVWFMMQENERIRKENERIHKDAREKEREEYRIRKEKRDEEWDKMKAEMKASSDKTDKEISKLSNLFTTQWGKLVEALVQPACLRLFQNRGIDITQSMENIKFQKGGDNMELDVMLVNKTELVIVEIKTTCTTHYVDHLFKVLKKFKKFRPDYKHYKVYGAIAALKFNSNSEKYAEKNGLFVLKATDDGIVSIKNDKTFLPKEF